ncbi:MAG: nucleotidyltransferase family protein [Bacteroidota bacterium]
MFQPKRAEHRLLLACAKTQGYQTKVNDTFEDASLDWMYVYALADHHRITPLLYFFLRSNPQIEVPEQAAAKIKAHAGNLGVANLFQTKELTGLLADISGAGLEAMPFKGPALGQYLYENVGLRPFGDLDILIHRKDFTPIKALLLQRGYKPYREFSAEEEARFLATQMGFEFVSKDERSVVEVHWSFLNAVHSFRLSEAVVWKERVQLDLAGDTVEVFSPAHLLVYLCAHGSKSLWARLRWVCDVAELVAKHQDEAFWTQVLQIAHASRGTRMLLTGLRLAHALLAAPLPDHIRRLVLKDEQVATLSADVVASYFAHSPDGMHTINPVTFHLNMQERFIDRLPYYKHLFQLWTSPSTKDKAFVALPRYLEFLYVLIKPIRMIVHRNR